MAVKGGNAGAGARAAMSVVKVGGFSLIEVVVATAMLALVCTAVSACVAQAQRGIAGLSLGDRSQRLVCDTLERLRSLPLYRVSHDAASGELQLEPCAVGELFPHALPERNEPDSWFAAEPGDGRPAGAFVTQTRCDGVTLQTTALFVVWTADGWRPVALSRLQGYAVWNARRLPSAALSVTVRAMWREEGRERSYALAAVLEGRSEGRPSSTAASAGYGQGDAP